VTVQQELTWQCQQSLQQLWCNACQTLEQKLLSTGATVGRYHTLEVHAWPPMW
jgi:hypothetical protein